MANRQIDIGVHVKEASDTSTIKLFDPEVVTRIEGIRVFDVGQGDCIGLIGPDNRVFCYVDYGGLADFPDVEDLSERMPVAHAGQYLSIVLTHWDKDHYWSARKRNPTAQKCKWLVPRQMVSIQATLFAADLEDAKCWPDSKRRRVESFEVGDQWTIEIRKCKRFSRQDENEDRNLTGLVVTLQQWAEDGVVRYMLLPGDCPFHHIPDLPPAPICRLVAYHHGAKTHWIQKTGEVIAWADDKPEMVYSYGHNNYGHPCRHNYKPAWDKVSTTTGQARARKLSAVDLTWSE